MTKTKLFTTTGLGVLLTLAVGCSTNKTAENSPVASGGDAKGTAPAAAAAKQADQAMVRFVNATTTSKDLAFGDTTPFTGIDARDVTAYKTLPAERHDLKLFAKDDKATPLDTNSEGLTSGKHYTVLAVMEKNGKQKLDPISDDLTPPAAGQAKVRLINLAPGAQKLDLYVAGDKTPLISGAELDSATDYKDVAPTQAALSVRHGMSKRNSAPVSDLKMDAGKLYTIIVFQDKSGKMSVKSVEDQFTAAPNGSAS